MRITRSPTGEPPTHALPAQSLTVTEWLAVGERFFSADDLGPLRKKAAQMLVAEHEAAVQRVAALEAEVRALNGSQPTGRGPASFGLRVGITRQLFPEPAELGPNATVPAIVMRFVAKNPGTNGADIAAHVREKKGEDADVFGALYRLTKPDGPIHKDGTRGNFRYFLKETK